MGMQVELASFEKPDHALLRDSYGENINRVKKFRTLQLLRGGQSRKYDIVVNTHGDMLPFFRQGMSKKNAITYCHYPMAGCLMDCGDPDYAECLQNLSLAGMTPQGYDTYRQSARAAYEKMMRNTTVLTNSQFSRDAILKIFGVNSRVLYPPVDTDAFSSAAASEEREDSVLVISRFHPSKKIENAIHLAKLLKQNGIAKCVRIAGNISPAGAAYYAHLRGLAERYDLGDFVRFEPNVRFTGLLEMMRQSKVYLHPLPGEPFGMSTVEAMSAGLVPVVPDLGGHTEFVPAKYQFHTFGQGVDAVAKALEAPSSERALLSRSAQKYSVANYVKQFQQIVSELLGIAPAKPVILAKKIDHAAA